MSRKKSFNAALSSHPEASLEIKFLLSIALLEIWVVLQKVLKCILTFCRAKFTLLKPFKSLSAAFI